MKKNTKILAIAVLLIGILAATNVIAQVEVSAKNTAVQFTYAGTKTVVKNGENKRISAPCDQELTLNVTYVNNGFKTAVIRKPAGACKIALELSGGTLINSASSQSENKASAYQNQTKANLTGDAHVAQTVPRQGNSVLNINLRISNATSKTFAVLSGPFKDVAISPMDTSRGSEFVKTGLLEFAILYNDSTNNMQLRQIAVTRIITQDMLVLEVKESDFAIPTRGKAKLYAFNKTGTKIVFTNGILAGVAISPGGKWSKKMNLSYGIESFVIEYFGPDGKKMRCNVEKIITQQDRIIEITKEDLKDGYVVQN